MGSADSQDKTAPAAVSIQDSQVPLAAGISKESGWAFLNLIFAVLAALMSVYVLAGKKQSKGMFKAGSAFAAICAIMIFILTAEMNLPMILADPWTAPIGLLTLLEAVITRLAIKDAARKKGN